MDNNALIVQMLLDRQRDIETLRAEVARLEQENGALRKAQDNA